MKSKTQLSQLKKKAFENCQLITSSQEIQELCLELKKQGKILALIPTMGDLHQGHLSLIKKAKEYAEVVIVSIFVNPTQFGANEDFKVYPRNLKEDKKLCQSLKVDVVFAPNDKELYEKNYSTYVYEKDLSQGLCGGKRQGHFRGVCTIITKLFNLTQAHYTFLGEKDFQQLQIIRQLIKNLNFPIKIIACPTIRESNGLAMSSRNKFLSNKEREKAAFVYQSLLKAKKYFLKAKTYEQILRTSKKFLETKDIKIDYLKICCKKTLKPLIGKINPKHPTQILIACFVNKIRLIDNIELVTQL